MASADRSPTVRPTDRKLKSGLGAAAICIALAFSACGSDDGTEGSRFADGEVVDISGTEPVGEVLAGSVAALVECSDWNQATDEQKQATIEDVRRSEYPENPGISGPVMTDEEARQLFDGACEPDYAGGFRLYKLYAHAVGFLPLKRALDEGESAPDEGESELDGQSDPVDEDAQE